MNLKKIVLLEDLNIGQEYLVYTDIWFISKLEPDWTFKEGLSFWTVGVCDIYELLLSPAEEI